MTHSTLIRTGLLLASLALLVFAIGPVQAVEESSWGTVKQAIDDNGTDRSPAAKRIKTNGGDRDIATTTASTAYTNDGRTVTGTFGPEGGSFNVKDDHGQGKKDDLEVGLIIPAGVLSEPLTITMTVAGDRYEDLIVSFEPAGFVFATPVDMRIDMGPDLVSNKDINRMTPYHLYADGTTQPVEIYHIDRSARNFNFFMKVPGFSRYGLTRY